MSNREDMTAWEVLREARNTLDNILLLTAENKPDEEATEKIQQALIVVMGAASVFSKHLADNDIHGIVGKEVEKNEGK